VRSALELAKAELQESGVALRTDFADGLPAVSVNTIEIEQVLLNLILNGLEAIRDSHSKTRDLSITTRRAGNDAVEVAVRDTGPGLHPDMAERIFEPFVSTKSYGLGMGLSISRTIVEGHGGTLSLMQDQGPGCAFAFTLPVEATDDVAA
jgi:C4-dicarboxylate-specific signal transduction histidine kinase